MRQYNLVQQYVYAMLIARPPLLVQTKETLTLRATAFGSKPAIPEAFLKKVEKQVCTLHWPTPQDHREPRGAAAGIYDASLACPRKTAASLSPAIGSGACLFSVACNQQRHHFAVRNLSGCHFMDTLSSIAASPC